MEESVGTVNNTRRLEGEKFYGDVPIHPGIWSQKPLNEQYRISGIEGANLVSGSDGEHGSGTPLPYLCSRPSEAGSGDDPLPRIFKL